MTFSKFTHFRCAVTRLHGILGSSIYLIPIKAPQAKYIFRILTALLTNLALPRVCRDLL